MAIVYFRSDAVNAAAGLPREARAVTAAAMCSYMPRTACTGESKSRSDDGIEVTVGPSLNDSIF